MKTGLDKLTDMEAFLERLRYNSKIATAVAALRRAREEGLK